MHGAPLFQCGDQIARHAGAGVPQVAENEQALGTGLGDDVIEASEIGLNGPNRNRDAAGPEGFTGSATGHPSRPPNT